MYILLDLCAQAGGNSRDRGWRSALGRKATIRNSLIYSLQQRCVKKVCGCNQSAIVMYSFVTRPQYRIPFCVFVLLQDGFAGMRCDGVASCVAETNHFLPLRGGVL